MTRSLVAKGVPVETRAHQQWWRRCHCGDGGNGRNGLDGLAGGSVLSLGDGSIAIGSADGTYNGAQALADGAVAIG